MRYIFVLALSPFVLILGAINLVMNLLAVSFLACVGAITAIIGVPYILIKNRTKKAHTPNPANDQASLETLLVENRLKTKQKLQAIKDIQSNS